MQESDGKWVDVDLWPMQVPVVEDLNTIPNLLVLKARQLGLTWLCVYEIVWRMLTFKGLQVGVYSLREEEAAAVVQRIRDVYRQVQPHWRAMGGAVAIDNLTHWRLENGSAVRAFSGRSGDSYTFGYVLVDEADLLEDLDRVLRSAEPTLSGGGCMRLVSRSNKTKPDSLFKKMYRAAVAGETKWKAVFLPWWARPGRTPEWYNREKKTCLATRGNLDFVYEQYPASASEALAPSESDKRFPMAWVEQCSQLASPIPDVATVPHLDVWELPAEGEKYVIGGDPAEGNPTSDESAGQVLTKKGGRQVARLRGRLQPAQFGFVLAQLARWYNQSPVLVERNNHGHAVILWMQDNASDVELLRDPRDDRPGWLSNSLGNASLYDNLAMSLRDRQVVIRDQATGDQLQTIQGADLSAPEGMPDDLADAFGLADQARVLSVTFREPSLAGSPRVDPVMPGPHGTEKRPGPPHWQEPGPMPFAGGGSGPGHWR